MVDEIERAESDDNLEDLPKHNWTRAPEPIVIRGVGHLTMFGLNSHFSTEFPSVLTGKLAPEEFHDTLRRVNYVLQRNVSRNMRWLVCGLLFCCCSFGISLWPVVCLNRRTISALEKTLDHENQQLYDKLGLHWKLARLPVEPSNRLTEFVLLLETLPRIPLSIPD